MHIRAQKGLISHNQVGSTYVPLCGSSLTGEYKNHRQGKIGKTEHFKSLGNLIASDKLSTG